MWQRLDEGWRVIPFARYLREGRAKPPANEVMVGRELERGFLIDALLNTGRKGAYLVTGHRGIGKTTFVHRCLDEYRHSIIERYWSRNVSRTLADRVGFAIVVLCLIGTLILVSEAVYLLADLSQQEEGGHHRVLLWLLIIPLSLVLLYPVAHAFSLLRTAFPRKRYVTLWGGIVLGLLWFLPWLAQPLHSAVGMLLILGGIYCCGEAGGVFKNASGKISWRLEFARFLVTIAGTGCILKLLDMAMWRSAPNLLMGEIALAFLALGLVTGAIHRRSLKRRNLYSGIAALSLPLAIFISWHARDATGATKGSGWIIPWLMVLFGVVFLVLLGPPGKDAKLPEIRPQVKLPTLFVAKALFLGILSLQLAFPTLSLLRSEASDSKWLNTIHEIMALQPWPGSLEEEALPAGGGPDLLLPDQQADDAKKQLFWILLVASVTFSCYFIEYEWVVRDTRLNRRDSSLLRAPPPSGDANFYQASRERKQARDHAFLTLPWALYRTWLPHLTVSVNLGFDRLDHRRVIQAMLAGLRREYNRTFLRWNSAFANLGRFVGLLLLLLLVDIAGEAWFNLPPVVTEQKAPIPQWDAWLEDEKTRLEARWRNSLDGSALASEGSVSTAEMASRCALYRSIPETSQAIRLLCRAGGDTWLNIAYFDLIPGKMPGGHGENRPREHEALLLSYFLPFGPLPPNEMVSIHQPAPNPEEAYRSLMATSLTHMGLWPLGTPLPATDDGPPTEDFCFRLYHLALLLIFAFAGNKLLRAVPVIPYRRNLRQIEDLLESLASRRSTSHRRMWQPARWIYGVFFGESVQQSEQDPLDPRTVELAFLHILEDLQETHLKLPGGPRMLLAFPSPEVTFVFDELDKLGIRVDPEAGVAQAVSQEIRALDAERARSVELHKLLSELKNMLSSAPARFIFVGGRNLHDEWLADLTARQPLLTNIFNAEVYLPSLLTDREPPEPSQAHDHGERLAKSPERGLALRINEYLFLQTQRARLLQEARQQKERSPSFGLQYEIREAAAYYQDRIAKQEGLPREVEVLSKHHHDWPLCRAEQHKHWTDFVYFLTFRSMGNPKKLKELLSGFVVPATRLPEELEEPTEHVLYFGEEELFRIQLLSSVYAHLVRDLEDRLIVRDDKLALSVFYLADFLFKFHRRAFSWTNVERVDELVHIHRVPDLREVMEEIVLHFSERFLVRILNGIYAYRFRSDLAREVEYLSRISAEEMAAFNFTLDESQALKALYAANLKDEEGRANPDVVAGLGELYEFDQEYENARHHYRWAIELADQELAQTLGERGQEGAGLPRQGSELLGHFAAGVPEVVLSVLSGEPVGRARARMMMNWGVIRLRLMLQLAMTFEQSRDLERAQVEYRDARNLARTLQLAYLDQDGRSAGLSANSWRHFDPDERHRLSTLKHLNILFQPVFGEAWVAEKLAGGVDTSSSLIEASLWDLRLRLPFVRERGRGLPLSSDPANVKGWNFGLIASQLHNKAGDLYFFKGRQVVHARNLLKALAQQDRARLNQPEGNHRELGDEGFLLRATYHYAVALHDLRRAIIQRRLSSAYKLQVAPEGWPTMVRGNWPDFIFSAAGNEISDFAEATLARTSLFGLLKDLREETETAPKGKRTLVDPPWNHGTGKVTLTKVLTDWFEGGPLALSEVDKNTKSVTPPEDSQDGSIVYQDRELTINLGKMGDWLGRRSTKAAWDEGRIVDFSRNPLHDHRQRLFTALLLSWAGADLMKRGGRPEEAGWELMRVGETAMTFLWWLRVWRSVSEQREEFSGHREWTLPSEEELPEIPYWRHLAEIAFQALTASRQCFRTARKGEDPPERFRNAICSLALATEGQEYLEDGDLRERIRGRMEAWCKTATRPTMAEPRKELERSIRLFSFPTANRLQGLIVLILHAALDDATWEAEEKNVLAQVSELRDLTRRYNAPLHITPLESGLVSAMVWIKLAETDSAEVERLRRAAIEDLEKSQQMITMGRAYYEVINNLFYLYDDFNDRGIHWRRALQMAGADLASVLLAALHGDLRRRTDDAPPEEDEPVAPATGK